MLIYFTQKSWSSFISFFTCIPRGLVSPDILLSFCGQMIMVFQKKKALIFNLQIELLKESIMSLRLLPIIYYDFKLISHHYL